jgi:tetratricopeptide (TPR) repeat protein
MSSTKRRRQKRVPSPDPTPKAPPKATNAPLLSAVSRKRLWLFRLAAILVAPLLAILLEVGLRLADYGYPTGFYVRAGSAGINMTNYRFGWRFFPPPIARSPEPHLLAAKPPGTIRIFVLGGSAAQGVPNPRFSFGRILEVMLRERYPSVRFELVNAAMTAINSHVVLEIARDCAAQQPDLFIIYMGNNEVVGPYGPGTTFQEWSPSLHLIRAGVRLRSTRVGQLLSSALRSFHPDKTPVTWRGMGMFMDNAVAADDPRLSVTYNNFRRNLKDICGVARRAGAATLLSTVAVNLRDCPPFASRHRADLRTDQLHAWESIYRAGIELQDDKRSPEALARYGSAAQLDDRFAELEFRMGDSLAALGRLVEARERFLAACDLDVLRFRADRRINTAIREFSAEQKADGMSLVDAEQLLPASDSEPGGILGSDIFFDHVHFTFDGNYLLARLFLDRVETALPQLGALRKSDSALSKPQCAQALTMTPWDEYDSVMQMLKTMGGAPFSNQLGHTAQIAALKERAESLARLSSRPDVFQDARRLYEAALEKTPEDWRLHHYYGKLLLDAGDSEQAARHMYVALKAYPWNLPLHIDLGNAEIRNGHNKEAIAVLQKALEIYPDYAAAHSGLITALARQGRMGEATAHFRKAVEIDPGDYDAYIDMGIALGDHGDIEGAMAHFRKALEINPENPVPYQDLGTALASQGRIDEAITFFRKAVDINPNYEAAHVNLGIALTGQGEIKEAIAHFRKAVEINPRNAMTYNNLGTALASQGSMGEALVCFRKAVEADPAYVAARINLGRVLGGQGRIEEAIVQMQKAIDIDPGDATAYYGMGQLLASRGRVDAAIAAYGQALRIRPDFTDARRELQFLHRVDGSTKLHPAS